MLHREQRTRRRPSGFTLLEVLVVVAIIVVLAGAAVPMFMNRLEEAKVRSAWSQTRIILQTCNTYRLANNDYPQTLQELVAPPAGGKPYLKEADLMDPWGHPYQYQPVGANNQQGEPDISSQGPNAADASGVIGSWMAKPPK